MRPKTKVISILVLYQVVKRNQAAQHIIVWQVSGSGGSAPAGAHGTNYCRHLCRQEKFRVYLTILVKTPVHSTLHGIDQPAARTIPTCYLMRSIPPSSKSLFNSGARSAQTSVEPYRAAASQPESMSLSQYLQIVSAVVRKNAPQRAWVTGEVVSVSGNGTHRYVDLAEHDSDHKIIAKARLNVWASNDSKIRQFEADTGVEFKSGIKVLVQVTVGLHAVYGLSLTLEEIDSSFTLGARQAKLKQIRAQLQALGLWTKNRQLEVPNDFFRVAVLSPANAAGLADFQSDAKNLADAGACEFLYFAATFQGETAKTEIPACLRRISTSHQLQPFDCAVIIRGGGAASDLNCLDELEIVQAVCSLPIPVLVGIGHQIDHVLLDEVAAMSFDTPSKVIKFITDEIRKRCHAVQAAMDTIRVQTVRSHDRMLGLTFSAQNSVQMRAQIVLANRDKFIGQHHAEIKGRAQALVGERTQAVSDLFTDCTSGAQHRVADVAAMNERHLNTVRSCAVEHVSRRNAEVTDAYQEVRAQSSSQVRVVGERLDVSRQRIQEKALSALSVLERRSDDYLHRTVQAIRSLWSQRKLRVEQLMQSTIGYGPSPTLRRGFALVRDGDGGVIKTVDAARAASHVILEFANGKVGALVEKSDGESHGGNR